MGMGKAASRRGVLPGFGLAMGTTLVYLSLLVLVPLAALVARAAGLSPRDIWEVVTTPRALAAFKLSLGAAALAAAINGVAGLLLAWVLERCPFPGRRLVDALIDLPFALPTAVAGIALATVWGSDGWLGRFAEGAGWKVLYTPTAVVLALVFVGLPFTVRSLQPVLRDLDPALEEAAASLGAGAATSFVRVVLPELAPALATGVVLALARGLGEYGSVIFVAGNMPLRSEITPLLIMIQLEQYDYGRATAIALVFLLLSLSLLLPLNLLARWRGRALAGEEA
jgi:sulfate/thiosulfate transport system permease protein